MFEVVYYTTRYIKTKTKRNISEYFVNSWYQCIDSDV